MRVESVATALLVAAGGLSGCERGRSETSTEGRPAPTSTLEWGFAGCVDVRPGDVCEVTRTSTVTIWARSTDGVLAPPEVEALRLVTTSTVHGGVQWRFRTSAGTATATVVERKGTKRFVQSLTVRTVERLGCSLELPQLGDVDSVAAFEASVLALPADERAPCWGNAAAAGRRRGLRSERTLEWLARAARARKAQGRLLSSTNSESTRAFYLLRDGRPDQGLLDLEELGIDPSLGPGQRIARWTTYGALCIEVGDFSGAREALQSALTWSERLGLDGQWVWAARVLLDVREKLGDTEGASALARHLTDRVIARDGAAAKGALSHVHWWTLLSRSRRVRAIGAPISAGVEAVDMSALRATLLDGLDRFPRVEESTLVNLAIEANLAHRFTQADAYLRRVEARLARGDGFPRTRMWTEAVRIRWLLATEKPAAALTRIEGLERLDFVLPNLAWVLAVSRVEAYQQLGDAEGAQRAAAQAFELIERWPGVAGSDRAYGGLSASLHRFAQRQIGWHVGRGEVAKAIEVARWVRVRELLAARRSDRIEALSPPLREKWLQLVGDYQRERARLEALPEPWTGEQARQRARTVEQLTASAQRKLAESRAILWSTAAQPTLRKPEAGELFLVIHTGPERWLLLATDGRDHWSVPLSPIGSDAATLRDDLEAALATLDTALEGARMVRVMPTGLAERVDVHALTWRGQALMRRRPVVYGLDVGGRREPANERRALVVGDPGFGQRGLANARKEAEVAHRVLTARGWRADLLIGDAARFQPVLSRLPHVDLFHFAGHVRLRSGGFGSAIELADEQRLAVRDVLALPSAPRVAFLTACESAREASRKVLAPDLGLAQAFVLSGADLVVATTRPVKDGPSARVGRALHQTAAYDAVSAAAVLSRLVRSDVPSDDMVSLLSYRVFVP